MYLFWTSEFPFEIWCFFYTYGVIEKSRWYFWTYFDYFRLWPTLTVIFKLKISNFRQNNLYVWFTLSKKRNALVGINLKFLTIQNQPTTFRVLWIGDNFRFYVIKIRNFSKLFKFKENLNCTSCRIDWIQRLKMQNCTKIWRKLWKTQKLSDMKIFHEMGKIFTQKIRHLATWCHEFRLFELRSCCQLKNSLQILKTVNKC